LSIAGTLWKNTSCFTLSSPPSRSLGPGGILPSSPKRQTSLQDPLLVEDTRPHDHRATEVRTARRLNLPYKYLYRHSIDDKNDKHSINLNNCTSRDYLMQAGGYTCHQIDELVTRFPPLLALDVQRHLMPKMRFLKETMLGMQPTSSEQYLLPEDVRQTLPPHYYGARLERTLAPRHAFLVYFNLPHGQDLLLQSNIGATRWQEFLRSCSNTKQFTALCNQWAQEEGASVVVTAKQVEAFDFLFGRGLMAAARDDLCRPNNTWPLDYVNISSAELIQLLVQHGANPSERDKRGVSLLHWAAGAGNLGGVQALLSYVEQGVWVKAVRDSATPLHWAAAGGNARNFGIGGHKDVAAFLLEHVFENCSHEQVQSSPRRRRDYVCQLTKDGNSALMWAAWSGTLETVKFLIRNRADPSVANRNGCTVAHWATSGGNVEVCRYLADTVGADFSLPNNRGNTPLTHAVAFGRLEVVEWLRREIVTQDDDGGVAAGMAWDFVRWADGQDENRQQVLNLFEDWQSHEVIT
jgi:ankyrin repeat protein